MPSSDALRRAFSRAAHRAGRVSVVVVDSRGRLHGLHPWRPFVGVSVVKAMLLVAYLRGQPAPSAGMRGFRPSGGWITTRITAADMALFFRDMERYIPARQRRFANALLAGITPSQSWGIPAAARPMGYRDYLKGGWLGAFELAHRAARLERRRLRVGLAVFTDGNPGSQYGRDTFRGDTERLLRR